MTFGNHVLRILFSIRLVRTVAAALARSGGPGLLLGTLALLGLRGRVSAARRALEGKVVAATGPVRGRVLLVGVKSYNYHYVAFYAATAEVTVIEPFSPVRMPAGVTLVRDPLERWDPRGATWDHVDFFGVYGYGLDERPAVEAAARAIGASVAPGGRLVFGFARSRDPLGLHGSDGVRRLFPSFRFDAPLALDEDVVVYLGERTLAATTRVAALETAVEA